MMLTIVLICFLASLLLTPIVRRIVLRFDITDKPDKRRINVVPIPSLGGVAIFVAFLIGMFLLPIDKTLLWPLVIGASVIAITGMLDDILELKARYKLLGQVVAAGIIVFWGGINITFINLPFGGEWHFGYLAIPLTIVWIVAITNAINLIDGLDGLAAGVSTIALLTIMGMAFVMGDPLVIMITAVLAAATLGFLPYNFYPAKIFMGDTGALFLGFVIAILSLMGFKNVTFISLIVPVLILGVPIFDTILAIIRRIVHRTPIAMADKSHLHHSLMKLGFTHRQTVILIYAISALFSLFALIFTMSTFWGSFLLILVLLVIVEFFVEVLGLVSQNYRPIMRLLRLERIEREEEQE
ncbi:undecaprenyl/decaprenyl-phosphate alpha-N-acetylglucosaminyl 1-phosphate transferase [Listeria grandensis]|uniref:Undecaprenyl/decaprenyl-phosphate alpha-N-acetylglucosaminyl 1-phosphate transferase n=2 Tax=Listeria grandensis TaxID=1494963 RepID=A0A7X1CQT7_9LIST|nr:MraY family glycosyltransferase [Listeria grandensis]MBC1937390.1 undecaprenyl/decaprenyl-phosphate alpha-N-acetylglucosaminyl 1-phosphate transferase [Listeria grandensis]